MSVEPFVSGIVTALQGWVTPVGVSLPVYVIQDDVHSRSMCFWNVRACLDEDTISGLQLCSGRFFPVPSACIMSSNTHFKKIPEVGKRMLITAILET